MSDPHYRVELLRASHDRAAFICGVPELDNYLHHQASQDARRKVAAPFVTLSAYCVYGRDLPEPLARKLPRYPLLPATLLGRLAVSQVHRGQKLGRLL